MLSKSNFLKGHYNFRRCANGPLETVPRYSYCSGTKLYDVLTIDGFTLYLTNGFDKGMNRVHVQIRQHFNLP